MRDDLLLRWSRDRGLYVIPGDALVREHHPDFRPLPFYISARKLGDPDEFNLAASDHGWPRLDVGSHQERLRQAIIDLDIKGGIENQSKPVAAKIFLAVTKVIDAMATPQECLHKLESLTR